MNLRRAVKRKSSPSLNRFCLQIVIDCHHGRAIQLQLRYLKKEGKIVTAVYTEHRLQPREDIGFTPIGLDEPYRIVVANNPVNFVDPYGLWRMPDYLSANINVAIPNPWTGTIIGWSGTASLDRYGNWYWSPLGGGIGKSATVVSFSATANWMNQKCKPSEGQLNNFLSGHGFNAAAGYWAGVSESWSPGNGTATGVGFVTPQIGVSYNYSFQGAGNTGLRW